MITGSPCDPFSVQRCKRFRAGDVKEHCDFKVTMQCIIQMFEKYTPAIGVMEQVMSFLMPFEQGGQVTPCDRRGHISLLPHEGPNEGVKCQDFNDQ